MNIKEEIRKNIIIFYRGELISIFSGKEEMFIETKNILKVARNNIKQTTIPFCASINKNKIVLVINDEWNDEEIKEYLYTILNHKNIINNINKKKIIITMYSRKGYNYVNQINRIENGETKIENIKELGKNIRKYLINIGVNIDVVDFRYLL